MKTTLEIPDSLMQRVKLRALQRTPVDIRSIESAIDTGRDWRAARQ